jgi:hypothetical protein
MNSRYYYRNPQFRLDIFPEKGADLLIQTWFPKEVILIEALLLIDIITNIESCYLPCRLVQVFQ